jgi:hypothetical protein
LVKRILPAVFVILLLLIGGIAVYALNEVAQLQTAVQSISKQIAPKPSYAMWTVGTGGDDINPYIEWVALYPESTLYPIPGAPSLRFSDQAPDDPEKLRDFEIGFYKYGPTWYSRNSITEFWLGNGSGGILSVAGNDQGGGELQVRNPTDTDSIRLTYRDTERPTIQTEHGVALHFSAQQGLISDDLHSFEQGISIPSASGYVGQVISGAWDHGSITIATSTVTATSLVTVTPLSQPRGQWWVSGIEPQQSFTVSSSAADEDMDFNWLIIGS